MIETLWISTSSSTCTLAEGSEHTHLAQFNTRVRILLKRHVTVEENSSSWPDNGKLDGGVNERSH